MSLFLSSFLLTLACAIATGCGEKPIVIVEAGDRVTPTPTASVAPRATATRTPSVTPTPSPTATAEPTPTATPTPTPIADRDCVEFASWEVAVAFFEDAGGPEVDPHHLDLDGDGIPCETLPREDAGATASPTPQPVSSPVPATVTPRPGTPTPDAGDILDDPSVEDRNCGDFTTWQQAYDFYIAAGGPEEDRHHLDGSDQDGIPCESLPGAPK